MVVIFVSPPARHVPVVRPVVTDSRSLWLESLDGTVKVPLDGSPIKLLTGAEGLSGLDSDVALSYSPDMDGAYVSGATLGPKQVILPLSIRAGSQAEVWAALDRLETVLQPTGALTGEGSCRLVCSSPSGERQLTLEYQAGLNRPDMGVPTYDRFPLRLVAPDPWARARVEKSTEPFRIATGEPFLSNNPANPWPRKLSSSTVLGQDMPVVVGGKAQVWPRIVVDGPFGPSLTVEADTGMSLTLPGGVPDGSTLEIVTDPRAKNITLDGALAAGLVSLGSRLLDVPFTPGTNLLSITAAGATASSQVQVFWREGWRSLWG